MKDKCDWIKIEHGLPDPDIYVLVFSDVGIFMAYAEKDRFYEVHGHHPLKVSHWMRLPREPNE